MAQTMTKQVLQQALEALEETRNALAWFYDSYPADVTPKGNKLLPHVETVLTALRSALAPQPELSTASKSEQLLASHDHALRAEFQRMKAALAQQGERPDYNICPSCGGMSSDPCVPIEARFPQQGEQQPVAWKHSCNALCVDGLELWTDACPHCGKPRSAGAAPAAQQGEQQPVAWMVTTEKQDGTRETYPITGRYKDVQDVCDFGEPIPLYAGAAPAPHPDTRTVVQQMVDALEAASDSIGSFTMDHGSSQQDFDNQDTVLAAIAAGQQWLEETK